jgi:serine/threonine protein phosphatase 1
MGPLVSLSTGQLRRPCAPDGRRIYAIGDIHGERELAERLLAKIRLDMAEHPAPAGAAVIFLGDYIDRGPDSRGVLDLLSDDPIPGCETRFLRGNHEQAMLDFLSDPVAHGIWLDFGGVETLASYGILSSRGRLTPDKLLALAGQLAIALSARHRDFLAGLEPYVVEGDFAFIHAGLRPGIPLAEQKLQDLIWIREPFLQSNEIFEKFIVHGHNIVEQPEILQTHVSVDTGAYSSGKLTAIIISGAGINFLSAEY